jgi:hypothetical protein
MKPLVPALLVFSTFILSVASLSWGETNAAADAGYRCAITWWKDVAMPNDPAADFLGVPHVPQYEVFATDEMFGPTVAFIVDRANQRKFGFPATPQFFCNAIPSDSATAAQ